MRKVSPIVIIAILSVLLACGDKKKPASPPAQGGTTEAPQTEDAPAKQHAGKAFEPDGRGCAVLENEVEVCCPPPGAWRGEGWPKGDKVACVLDGLRQGPEVVWHENARVRSVADNGDDKRHGLQTTWHKNGKMHNRFNFMDGLQDGPWEEWRDSGLRHARGTYRLGRRNGPEKVWHKDGKQLKSEGSYVEGERVGKWTEWYKNGNRKFEIEYRRGRRHGKETHWFKDGTLWFEAWHENGKQLRRVDHAKGQKKE